MGVLLAREEIDINARDWQGCTTLSLAVQSRHRDFTLLLLEYGADPNIKDDKGQVPIQKLFDDKIGEYSITCSREEVDGDSLEDYYHGERGQAGWHFVSRSRRIDIMKSLDQEEIFQALVREGADLDTLDINDRNLLMLACLRGNSVLAANLLYAVGG
ncbi:hypothetical protein M409DRAFT_30311 [Zasmidium cellare ATCC 36951]|uniref:Uncharacterized protein n=1 Tax=Zasmidium cellare ATCC 36951 TaxID=1080233 RepID=A0A6A6C006_ZASCE|nr:uncharacterized protein M409DRAFT_30311 [Zasmidium cellare ATCC 36951]KAF2159172.1 hypothetical protein M409DRAFT_30311 [Zasmidium cellare ATCC 36951]